MKKLYFPFAILCIASINAFAANEIKPFNMAYVEVNDHYLSNVGCYVRADNQKYFFDIVSILGANINGTDPNKPVIYFNPQVDTLLNKTQQVANLQKKGIKVLLTLLGNHQNAGWSCMTDETSIQRFADAIVATINKYKLDGVDIDDEYSTCYPNKTSMIRIAQAIKNHPGFKGKLLTKALFQDSEYFTARYQGKKLADFLDLGFEMTYGYSNFAARLSPYVSFGMLPKNLSIGLDVGLSQPSPYWATVFVMQNGYGGVMVYNVGNNSRDYLSQIAQAEYGTSVNVLPLCLQK